MVDLIVLDLTFLINLILWGPLAVRSPAMSRIGGSPSSPASSTSAPRLLPTRSEALDTPPPNPAAPKPVRDPAIVEVLMKESRSKLVDLLLTLRVGCRGVGRGAPICAALQSLVLQLDSHGKRRQQCVQ